MYFVVINALIGFFFLFLIIIGILLKYHSFIPINAIGILIVSATIFFDKTQDILPGNVILIMLALVIIFITDIIFIFRDFREEVTDVEAKRRQRYLIVGNNEHFKLVRDIALIKSDIELHKNIPLADRVQAAELIKQGNQFFEKEQYQDALEQYDLSCDLVKSSVGYLNQSGVLLKSGQFEDALVFAQKAAETKSNFYEAYLNQGVALEKMKEFSDALKKYEQAAKLNPDEDETWFCAANILFKMGKYVQAINNYDKALALQGKNFDAWYYKGIALQRTGKLAEALRAFEQANKLKSHHAKLHYRMGNILTALNRDSEAIAAYEKSIRLNPESEEAWNNLGVTLNKIGRLNDALKCYERATKINDKYAEAWFNRALALDTLNKTKKAYESYLKFIAAAPEAMEQRVEMAKKRANEIKLKLKNKEHNSLFSFKKKGASKSKKKK